MAIMDTELLDTHTDTTERDLLMLSQRLMPMLTTDTTDMVSDITAMDTELMDMDTHTDTTEKDPLMLRLMPLSSMELMDTHTLESTPPTLLLATLLPTPQPESLTPAMSESAPTTSEPRFLARHSHRSETSSD